MIADREEHLGFSEDKACFARNLRFIWYLRAYTTWRRRAPGTLMQSLEPVAESEINTFLPSTLPTKTLLTSAE